MYPLIWFIIAGVALLVEAFSVTLYGLVIAVGCIVAGTLAYMMGGQYHWIQLIACLICVVVGSWGVPRVFRRAGKEVKIGLDEYIGQTVPIKIVENTYKVTLNGVDRLVEVDGTVAAGQQIKITGRKGTILTGEVE